MQLTYGELEKGMNELLSKHFDDEFIENNLNSFWFYNFKNKEEYINVKIDFDDEVARIVAYFTDFNDNHSSVLLSVCDTKLSMNDK